MCHTIAALGIPGIHRAGYVGVVNTSLKCKLSYYINGNQLQLAHHPPHHPLLMCRQLAMADEKWSRCGNYGGGGGCGCGSGVVDKYLICACLFVDMSLVGLFT